MGQGLTRPMRRPQLLPLLAAGCGAWLAAAQAQTAPPPRGAGSAPETIRPLLGAWEIALSGAARSCTITFGAEEAPHGRQLRFPATCRRALPILAEARSWSLAPGGGPQLHDGQGKVVIAFAEGTPSRGFAGKGTDGQSYGLAGKDHPRAARRPPPSAAELRATAAQRPTVVDPARAPAAESLPGRYVLMRQPGREACRLVLAPASGGQASAAFDGPCRDTGLTIFDPVGWRYAGGRLTLIARRGHGVDLVFEDGHWRKDPAVGAPLMMRKLEP